MKNNQIRATGASCKECRRLKIKCDKQVPCGTCTKRGLQSLCPDGQLSGAKGSRYVLATAEESWHRIQALCVRVQDLEFALERAHSQLTNEHHPLLEEELIKIGKDPRSVVKVEPGKSPVQAPEDVPIANLGTMKISKSGSYRWLGTTALPAMMLDEYDDDETGNYEFSEAMVPREKTPNLLGYASPSVQELKLSALQALPSRQKALQLIEIYFESYSRWATIIDRSTVIDSLFSVAYDGNPMSLSAYNISSLLCILALGTIYEETTNPAGQEFKAQRKLARALFFSELPKGPATVEELESHLLIYRVSWPFIDTNPSDIYEFMAWGVKLAEKIGLHRDPEPLNLSPEECLRRRRVFWALWYYDSNASLLLGQPPTLAKGFVSCKPPLVTPRGDPDIHPRCTIIMQDILTHFLEAKSPPPYAAALRIDQKIREINWDPTALPTSPTSGSPSPASRDANTAYVGALKSTLLLALHKPYFTNAVMRSHEDPIAGRFATSTQAIFDSARTLLEAGLAVSRYTCWMRIAYIPIWMQYHTAVLVLYAFPTYLPYWSRSEEAMKAADVAITDLFQPSAKDSESILKILPSLLRAQQRAQESYIKYKSGQWSHPSTAGEKDANQDLFINEKFLLHSTSGYDTSRASSPSDHHAASYPESTASSSAYHNNWVGFDSPTVASTEIYGHFSQGNSYILSPQRSEGHFDESSLYKGSAMDWTQQGPIPKVESPPHSAGLYPSHPQQFPPVQHLMQTGLQIPGEIIGVPDHRHATIRRVRGLSRAHSFPSDHAVGYSSAGSVQTHTFQSMHSPLNMPAHSPTTPVGPGTPIHTQGLEHQVHEPYGRWIQSTVYSQDPYRQPHSHHNHGYAPQATTVHQHNPASPTDPAAAVPLHVLDQSWNNFNVQHR